MRAFLAFVMLTCTFAQELVAEVRHIPDQCGIGDSIQYWINTAAAARETTLQVIGGDFILADLDVTGDSTMKSTTVTDLKFDYLTEKVTAGASTQSTFRYQTKFNGGFHLTCPVDKCIVEADTADANNIPKVEFRNLDIIVQNMNIRTAILALQAKVNALSRL